MTKNKFSNIIYAGYDYPADGIGNHLSLLDRLIFDTISKSEKSLHAIAAPFNNHPPYGLVPTFIHLDQRAKFNDSLYLDISRDMSDPEKIETSRQRAIAHKNAFNAVTALYLMWESDQLSPPLESLPDAFDFVIVTSNLLDDYLSKRNIDYCHLQHPYDYALNTQIGGKNNANSNHESTVFGISCGLWQRKNVSLLAQTFAATFGDNPDYILKIHTRFDVKLADFTSEQKLLTALLASHKNIQLESRSLNREEYITWISSLDVYCFISSGEGYSVTPREALDLGVPTILLDAHVHSEFSHLPGIIKVESAGKKLSIPNQSTSNTSQGYDWIVDTQSLKSALLNATENHVELREELKDNISEVIKFHDIKTIKSNWENVLKQKYAQYIGKPNTQLPSILELDRENYQIESAPRNMDIQYQMRDPFPARNTGENTNKGTFCFSSKHQAGHCAYGHNLVPPESTGMEVQFFIDILDSEINDTPLVNLEVYDSKADEIICLETYSVKQLALKPTEPSIHFSANPNQRLEFRVYWHGTVDIWVRNIKLL
jgi:glycosyltransferase involved in cell wall biosynthesis